MNRLFFTIVKDQLIYNKQQKIALDMTNIPQQYGIFNGYFYWEAEIVACDESSKTLHARIINYEAPKEFFDTAPLLPYHFEQIQFEAIDLAVLRSCLDYLSESLEIDAEQQKKSHPSLGQLCEHFDVNLSYDQLVVGSGYLKSVYVYKGQEVLIKIALPSVTTGTIVARNLFQRVLKKRTALVNVFVYEKGVVAYSDDLKKAVAACPQRPGPLAARKAATSIQQPMMFPYKEDRATPKPSLPSREDSGRITYECKESTAVKFTDLTYEVGRVSFEMKCTGSQKVLRVAVDNSTIRPEFKYITKYFCNVFGKEKATFDLTLKKKHNHDGEHYQTEVLAVSSREIDRINSDLIVEIQKDYCIDFLFAKQEEPKLENVDEMLDDVMPDSDLKTAQSLVELIAERKPDSKHVMQLRYLASLHLSNRMPLKRGDDPRSLLFLVQGDKKLYLVLETVSSKLATYVWTCSDGEEGLQSRIKEVDDFIATTDTQKRRKYRNAKPDGFEYIEHKYQNLEEDFLTWQKEFTEIIS